MHDAGFSDMTAHGLRKFYNVELQAARIPKEWRYQMMGKKVGAYDEKRIRKLFEGYKEAYDHLRIFDVNTSKELVKIKKDMELLREENRILREQMKQITAVRSESDDIMNKLFDDAEFKDLLTQKLKAMKT